MPSRPVWSGELSFGLVTIPVNLYPATEEKDIQFHQLHKGCGARVRYQKVCPVHKDVLEADEIERGYEVSKGRYVVISDEDLKRLPIPSKHTIEMSAFFKIEEVDPMLFDRAYYVEPETAGKKPLALLAKAIQSKGVVGLGKVALRNREGICVLRLRGKTFVLEMLHWPDEIRTPISSVEVDDKVDPKQLKMAESLIDLLEAKFDPSAYHDEYRDALMQEIEAKKVGSTTTEPDAKPTEVIDLMEALRRSVETAKDGKRKAG